MQIYCTFVLFVNQHYLGLPSSGTLQLGGGYVYETGLVYIVYTTLNCVKHVKCKCFMYILTDYYRLRMTKDRPNLSSEKTPHREGQ
jgi:hypothetical protein